jgi:uncharacterized protein
MNEANPAQLVPYVTAGAFALAFVFGAVANKTNFCTMGAVSDWVNMGDTSRLRMWLLAVAVALLGSSALEPRGSSTCRSPSTPARASPGSRTSSAASCSASA